VGLACKSSAISISGDAGRSLGTGGVAGGVSVTGGVPGQGGAGGSIQSKTGGDAADSAPADDGPQGSPDNQCDVYRMLAGLVALPHALNPSLLPECIPADAFGVTGNLVFDGDGRLLDDTGYPGTEVQKQAWLDSLAQQRWPCWAGQTIAYQCISQGI
jgi:hypothetical protein